VVVLDQVFFGEFLVHDGEVVEYVVFLEVFDHVHPALVDQIVVSLFTVAGQVADVPVAAGEREEVDLALVVADDEVLLKVIRRVGLDDFHAHAHPVVLFVVARLVPLACIPALVEHDAAVCEADAEFLRPVELGDAGAPGLAEFIGFAVWLERVATPL